MTSIWRSVGMTYIEYSNLCAQRVRECVKKEFSEALKRRETANIRFAPWQQGKPLQTPIPNAMEWLDEWLTWEPWVVRWITWLEKNHDQNRLEKNGAKEMRKEELSKEWMEDSIMELFEIMKEKLDKVEEENDKNLQAIHRVRKGLELLIGIGLLGSLSEEMRKGLGWNEARSKKQKERNIVLDNYEKAFQRNEISMMSRSTKRAEEIATWLTQKVVERKKNLVGVIIMAGYLPELVCEWLVLMSSKKDCLKVSHWTPGNIEQLEERIHQFTILPEEQLCIEQANHHLNLLIDQGHPTLMMDALLYLTSTHQFPTDVRHNAGHYLSKIILKPNGIAQMMAHLLGKMVDEDQVNIRQMEQLSKIILSVPKDEQLQKETYFDRVGEQLVDLIMNASSTKQTLLLKTSCFVAGRMMIRFPSMGRLFIMDRLSHPFKAFYQLNDNKDTEEILVDEDAITRSIEGLHRLIAEAEPHPSIVSLMSYIIPPLFKLYVFTTKSKSFLRTASLEILTIYFKRMDDAEKVVIILKELLLPSPFLNQYLTFSAGSSGGVVIKHISENIRDIPAEIHCAMEILESLKNNEIPGVFFLELLKDYLSQSKKFKDIADQEEVFEIEATHRDITLLQVIIAINERLGPSILQHAGHVFEFFISILRDQSEDEEMITLSLSILSTLFMGSEEGSEKVDIEFIDDLFRILEGYSTHEEPQIRQMAKEIRLQIIKIKSPSFKDEQSNSQLKEVQSEKKLRYSIQQVINELQDPLLPIRAHALIALRELILQKESQTIAQLSMVENIFIQQIQDEESFIYLNAIKGIAAMADAYPEQYIGKTIDFYLDTKKFTVEIRERFGESLMLLIQRAGQTIGHYINLFLPRMFSVLREEALIRGSMLSILSTIAQIAPFSLYPYLQEFMFYSTDLLRVGAQREDVEARRGALYVLSETIHSLQHDMLIQFPDILRQAYRTLKLSASNDADSICQFHAIRGLDKLETLMKEFLLPKQNLPRL